MLEHFRGLSKIGYFSAPAGKKVTPVTIPFFYEAVELVTGGTVFFEVNGEKQPFGKGAMFWHVSREKTIWNTPSDDPYSCYVFYFEARPPTRKVPRVTLWNDPAEAESFASRMFRLFHKGEYSREVLGTYIYTRLLWEGTSARNPESPELPLPLQRAKTYMERQFASPIGPDEIALQAGISRPALFRLFREKLSTTPHTLLLKLRLDKAKLLLAGDDIPIKEIPEQCGFESIEVFYRQFRNSVQMTPAEYRKRYTVQRTR